jgi:hypothetical protein
MMESHICVIDFIIGAREGRKTFIMGRSPSYQITAEKNIVKACMKAPATNRYYILDFSFVRQQALHEDNLDATTVSEKISQQHIKNDMI